MGHRAGTVRPLVESDAARRWIPGAGDARTTPDAATFPARSGRASSGRTSDSAVVACLAARALGRPMCWGRVHAVAILLSDHSRSDAAALAAALGIQFRTISIEPMFAAYLEALAPAFAGRPADVTEEESAGAYPRRHSHGSVEQTGALLLSTGNKSEIATGYCTLYGDTCGGLAVLSDVPKTLVYQDRR